eukprot:6715964-Lingulodinium_polyedra.AAC.1
MSKSLVCFSRVMRVLRDTLARKASDMPALYFGSREARVVRVIDGPLACYMVRCARRVPSKVAVLH